MCGFEEARVSNAETAQSVVGQRVSSRFPQVSGARTSLPCHALSFCQMGSIIHDGQVHRDPLRAGNGTWAPIAFKLLEAPALYRRGSDRPLLGSVQPDACPGAGSKMGGREGLAERAQTAAFNSNRVGAFPELSCAYFLY